MADPRFFIDSLTPAGDQTPACRTVVAHADDLHHMVNVARIAPGERIEVVTRGDWQPYSAVVVAVDRGATPSVILSDVVETHRSGAPFSVSLAFGLAKGDKTDTIVRQAVEIGVDRIVPVMFQRSIVRLSGDKVTSRRTRLQSIAESAAKQSHQQRIPSVDEPTNLGSVLLASAEHDLTLIAWEETGDNELSDVIDRAAGQVRSDGSPFRVLLVVGPEGGIDAAEVAQLVDVGGVAVSLGPSILRVDTAVAVGLGITFDALRRNILAGA